MAFSPSVFAAAATGKTAGCTVHTDTLTHAKVHLFWVDWDFRGSTRSLWVLCMLVAVFVNVHSTRSLIHAGAFVSLRVSRCRCVFV